jgi:hypothetical protein
MPDDIHYFFASGSEQRGPYTLEQFVALGLRPDTLIWHEGMANWQRLDSVESLRQTMFPPAVALPSSTMVAPAGARLPLQPLAYEMRAPALTPSGLSIASLVLGILSIVSMCAGHFSLVALPCSILAITFGFIAKARANRGDAGGKGFAIAGLVCGFIHLGLVAIIVMAILGFCIVAGYH